MTAARREQIVCGAFTVFVFSGVLIPTWYLLGSRMLLSAGAFMTAFFIVTGLMVWLADVWIERGE